MNIKFNIDDKVITTARLILRAFKPSDLNDFYQYASVAGVGEMAGWSHHQNIEESKMILDIFIHEDDTFAIVDKVDNKVIGSLGIHHYKNEDTLTEFKELVGCEIGFVLAKDYWGQGLMKEAVIRVIDYLFNELNFDFILCGHFNIGSIK